MREPSSPPKTARLLSYAGLVPFLVLSAALWFAAPSYTASISDALLRYAGIILAFIGAVHWGLAMASGTEAEDRQWVLSISPALIAWIAGFFPPEIHYSILYITFGGLCIIDSQSNKLGNLPDWYPRLRVPLTVIVVISLINAHLTLALA
jgi:hypothetical protein